MDWVRIPLFLTHFWYFWDVVNNVSLAELETWQWTLQWSRRPRRAWGRSWRSLPSPRSCWASRPSDFFMTSSPSSLGTREPCQANISNSSLLNESRTSKTLSFIWGSQRWIRVQTNIVYLYTKLYETLFKFVKGKVYDTYLCHISADQIETYFQDYLKSMRWTPKMSRTKTPRS